VSPQKFLTSVAVSFIGIGSWSQSPLTIREMDSGGWPLSCIVECSAVIGLATPPALSGGSDAFLHSIIEILD